MYEIFIYTAWFLMCICIYLIVKFWIIRKAEKREYCGHQRIKIKVLWSSCTCEKTVTVCKDCGKELDEPKIDC